MSLDVYLTLPGAQVERSTGIFIREDGRNKEITRAEWDARFPDSEPFTVTSDDSDEVFSRNITHNLNKMADAAGLYDALWRPDEHGMEKAADLLVPLAQGLWLLKSDPERFKAFNPTNGWGDYSGLVEFTERYLAACAAYPTADVRVSR